MKNMRVNISINKVIRFLTLSDILMLSGWGLINPIFAVFVTDQIQGGNVEMAGLAITVFLLTKSLVQMPIAWLIDKKRGEIDDFWVMIIGSLIISLSAFLFIFANNIFHVLLIQVISGFGSALSYPSWLAIFTRHLDTHKEGFEWSLYFTATDLGGALVAGLGGVIANYLGFQPLFLLVGLLSFLGTAFLGVTYKDLGRKP
ncbi:MFS transporter [Patescibacteria group bacterium]|nr:MFS transporter [Patescibacteria group bacterium]